MDDFSISNLIKFFKLIIVAMAGYYLYISMKQKKESNPLNIRKVGLLDKISLFGGDFEYWHCPSCQGKIIILL